MNSIPAVQSGPRNRALWLSMIAMAVCFAVWVIFSIVGVQLQKEMGFSQTAFGLLVAVPILTGSISRVALGIWSEQFGGRRVYAVLMLIVAACVFALPYTHSYPMLLLVGLGLGLAGGSFSVGVVYVSSWFPKEKQGTALGTFGMGNAGAALTSFGAPLLLTVMDWRHAANVYGIAMVVMTLVFWLGSSEDPLTVQRRVSGAKHPRLSERLEPLRSLQVWRFSLYYFLVFGGYIALTSWLPRYYIGAYGVSLQTAGMLTACFVFPTAVLRSVGGILADRYGARRMMYIAFSMSLFCLFLLSYPNTHYTVEGIRGPIQFAIAPSLAERVGVLFVLGAGMALGMAAVFKHIPTYYPQHVGAVGGVVGMIGGLGGFFLPIVFGVMNDHIGIWSGCFMLLFCISGINLLWMHFAVLRMNRLRFPQLKADTDLPEIMQLMDAAEHARNAARLAAAAADAAADAALAAAKKSRARQG